LKLVALVNDKLAHLEREMGETRSVLSEIKEWTIEHRREHYHTRLALYGIVATMVVTLVRVLAA